MEKKVLSKNILSIVLGALLLVAGILIIIIAAVNPGSIDTIIRVTVSVILFIMGGLAVVSGLLNYKNNKIQSSLVYGPGLIAFGVLLLQEELGDAIFNLLRVFSGVFLISFGAIFAVIAVLLIVKKAQRKEDNVLGNIIAYFIIAALGIALGIIFICFGKNEFKQFLYVVLGLVCAIIGLSVIIIRVVKNRKSRKDKKAKDTKKKIENADVVEIEEEKDVKEIEDK